MKISWDKLSVAEIAGLICEHLDKKGFNAILTGGACVCIYSNNEYKSSDLDFVMPSYDLKQVDFAMEELGFTRQKGWRHYINPDCFYYVEFPPPPLAVGSELVNKIDKINTKRGILKLLSPTDCVKDRLAAYYHWKDPQSLDQAVLVANQQKVNLTEIRRWSKIEESIEGYKKFRKEMKRKKKNKVILG